MDKNEYTEMWKQKDTKKKLWLIAFWVFLGLLIIFVALGFLGFHNYIPDEVLR